MVSLLKPNPTISQIHRSLGFGLPITTLYHYHPIPVREYTHHHHHHHHHHRHRHPPRAPPPPPPSQISSTKNPIRLHQRPHHPLLGPPIPSFFVCKAKYMKNLV